MKESFRQPENEGARLDKEKYEKLRDLIRSLHDYIVEGQDKFPGSNAINYLPPAGQNDEYTNYVETKHEKAGEIRELLYGGGSLEANQARVNEFIERLEQDVLNSDPDITSFTIKNFRVDDIR